MSQETLFRLWVVLGISIVVVAGLVLLMAFLGREPSLPAMPAATIFAVTPTSSDSVVVASVNGHPIRRSFWMEAVLLDHVMGGLAGQAASTPDETLQRLINEELVLRSAPLEQEPTAEQIEARIASLEQAWGVDAAAVVTALERVALTRAVFERAVGRLLMVQASLETLQSQGFDTTSWLEEQRASAEIVISQDVAVLVVPSPQPPLATLFTSPIPTPTTEPTIFSPTPVPATETPAPTLVLVLPKVAPDFTLEQAAGGTLTLAEQLAQGPVVLVFFQRCG